MIQVNRETLHRWLDELAEEDVPLVARILSGLRSTPANVQPCPECGALEHEPNEETRAAILDSERGVGVTNYDSVDDLFRALRG